MRVLGGHWEHKEGLGRILRRVHGFISATGASQALCQSWQRIAVVSLVPLLTLVPSLSTGLAVPILSLLHAVSLVSLPEVPSSGTVTSVSLGFLGHWVFSVLLVSPLRPVPCCPPNFLIVPIVPTAIWGPRGCWSATAQ